MSVKLNMNYLPHSFYRLASWCILLWIYVYLPSRIESLQYSTSRCETNNYLSGHPMYGISLTIFTKICEGGRFKITAIDGVEGQVQAAQVIDSKATI